MENTNDGKSSSTGKYITFFSILLILISVAILYYYHINYNKNINLSYCIIPVTIVAFMLILYIYSKHNNKNNFLKHLPYGTTILVFAVIVFSVCISLTIGKGIQHIDKSIFIAIIITLMFYSLYIVSLYQINFNMSLTPNLAIVDEYTKGLESYKKQFSNPLLVLFSIFILFQSVLTVSSIIYNYEYTYTNATIFVNNTSTDSKNNKLSSIDNVSQEIKGDKLSKDIIIKEKLKETQEAKNNEISTDYDRQKKLKIYKTVFSVSISLLSYTSMMFLLFIIKMFEKRLFTYHYNNYFFVAIGIVLINGFIVFISSKDGLSEKLEILSFVPSILLGIAPNLLFIIYNTFRQYKGVNNILNENILLDEITTNASKRQIVEISLQQHNLITVGDILSQPYNIYKFLLLPIVPAHNDKLISTWIEKLIMREILGRDMYRYVTNVLGCNNLYELRKMCKARINRNDFFVFSANSSTKDNDHVENKKKPYECEIKALTPEEVTNKITMSYWKSQEHINSKFNDKNIVSLVKRLLKYALTERDKNKDEHTNLDNDIREIDEEVCSCK